MMIDLRDCFDEDGSQKPEWRHEDLSGRPIPKGVRFLLNSGIEVPCEVVYDGRSDGDARYRRYLIKAEVNWARHHVVKIIADENPIDVQLIMLLPDTLDSELMAEQRRLTANVQMFVGKQT